MKLGSLGARFGAVFKRLSGFGVSPSKGKYALDHLVQDEAQEVLGPIQDDEALLLYSVIRAMRLRCIVEIGGLGGYSARNFCRAVSRYGKVVTIDINEVPRVAPNHLVIKKDCRDISERDLRERVDMIFFDAHVYDEQIEFFNRLQALGLVADNVVIALHDTGLHPKKVVDWAYWISEEGGWCHQPVERRMVGYFKSIGFDAICFHTQLDEVSIKFRHGVTLMKRFKPLCI